MRSFIVSCALLVAGASALSTLSCDCTPATAVTSELGGQTFSSGCYESVGTLGINGILTLSGSGNFVFKSVGAFTTGASRYDSS